MDREAVGQITTLVVALGIFSAVFVGLVLFTNEQAAQDGDPATASRLDVAAQSVADILVGTRGVGWEDGVESVQRVGLRSDDGLGVDPVKLDALRGALNASDPTNGKLDYQDVLAGLGMPTDGSVGLHIRINQRGPTEIPFAVDLSTIRTAYVGDWPDLPTIEVAYGTPNVLADNARAELDAIQTLVAERERRALEDAGLSFDNRTHLDHLDTVQTDFLGNGVDVHDLLPSGLQAGDIFLDDPDHLGGSLPDQLDLYDLIVVGSEVDQSNFADAGLGNDLRDWVHDGGVLWVLGSSDQDLGWLEPLFDSAIPTINHPPVIPDPQHPALVEPNKLRWPLYEHHGQGWDLSTGSPPSREHYARTIVVDGLNTLVLSVDGVYDEGSTLLTTYRLAEISANATQGGAQEAQAFVENIVQHAFGLGINLDYGPTPPRDAAVASAVRTTQAWDDRAGRVTLEVQVLVWGIS